MIVLSLFDGMSCGMVTLKKLGVPVTKYYASEVDKFAIAESKANHPEIEHLGDVTKWREWDIDWSTVDLLIGGSPCQGFSYAGKQLAFDDPRSALFFVFVEILNHVKFFNPRLRFMLENVKMKKDHLNVITEYMGVDPVFINSALVCAQNRQRYYWCNWYVPQPSDRGILLGDILEDGFADRDKSRALLASCYRTTTREYFKKNQGQMVLTGVLKNHGDWSVKNDKANCIDANYFKGVDNHGQRTQIFSAAVVGRRINPVTGRREDYNYDLPIEQILEVSESGKLRCLSTVSKDTLISILPPGRYLEAEMKEYYRKLTVVECCRLQGVPDDYFKVSSNTQAYKMLGNGWQCDTIEHIFFWGFFA